MLIMTQFHTNVRMACYIQEGTDNFIFKKMFTIHKQYKSKLAELNWLVLIMPQQQKNDICRHNTGSDVETWQCPCLQNQNHDLRPHLSCFEWLWARLIAQQEQFHGSRDEAAHLNCFSISILFGHIEFIDHESTFKYLESYSWWLPW